MEWKYCDCYGNLVENNMGYQVDEVKNILQQSGAVQTKACQNCGNEFLTKVIIDEVRQEIRGYTCDDCDFHSNLGDEALSHTIENKDHVLNIKEESRIVGYKNTLDGSAIVTFTKHDCIILCNNCNDIS